MMRALGATLAADWLEVVERLQLAGAYRYHPGDAGRRALVNLALRYLAAAGMADGLALAEARLPPPPT
jgi:alanyl aminopeptidase. Metallo peptidase. MEROPS family M01